MPGRDVDAWSKSHGEPCDETSLVALEIPAALAEQPDISSQQVMQADSGCDIPLQISERRVLLAKSQGDDRSVTLDEVRESYDVPAADWTCRLIQQLGEGRVHSRRERRCRATGHGVATEHVPKKGLSSQRLNS